MKGLRRFTALAIGAGVITAASVVRADDGCSLASLKGPYAIEGQGTVVAQLPGFPAPPAPWAESVLVDFDGAGTFSGKATVNIGGVVIKPTFTGTYTVNSDCTGDATINTDLGLTLHRDIVVIGGGQRFIETDTDPFAVIQSRAEKLGRLTRGRKAEEDSDVKRQGEQGVSPQTSATQSTPRGRTKFRFRVLGKNSQKRRTPMSNLEVVRAWKDPEFRATLGSVIPDHPAGRIEFADPLLDRSIAAKLEPLNISSGPNG